MKKTDQYYLKDKKAIVYKRFNGRGIFDPACLRPISSSSSLWCYTRQLSQDVVFQAKSYGEDETRYFVFGYSSRIKPQRLIFYADKWYEITRADRKDDYLTDVIVYAKDIPEPTDEILPYDPDADYDSDEATEVGGGSGDSGGSGGGTPLW